LAQITAQQEPDLLQQNQQDLSFLWFFFYLPVVY